MSLILNIIPGFSDLPDATLDPELPAFGLHVAQISSNATFGMVRCEVFQGLYVSGDTVPLPISGHDGYVYSREELIYLWTVRNSTDPKSAWITGPDSLWFCNWDVDQSTGAVFSEEWYERSKTADSWAPAQSNDGTLLVFTIAQRQKTNMIMAAAASYTSIDETTIATDKPLTQDLAQHLNEDAKFSVVNSEVFYLGEYVDGDTVTLPVSSVDGHAYTAAECKFQFSWRWTTLGTSYTQPPRDGSSPHCDQLGPFKASIDSSGVVSITVSYVYDGGEPANIASGYGRIAAFAFCTRSATPATGTLADSFTEIDPSLFFPGNTLRASRALTIKRNIDEALWTPEFFGPTEYGDGDTVPLPTSSADSYAYSRSEITCIWSWSDTKNNADAGWLAGHSRVPLFLGIIDQTTGVVTLNVWRLRPGGPYDDDHNENARIRVIVMASRQAALPALTDGTTTSTPTGTTTTFATTGQAIKEIAIPSTTAGDFSLAHGLSVTPSHGWIQITADGLIRFQTTRYDGTNVNLNASADGLTGYVVLTYLATA